VRLKDGTGLKATIPLEKIPKQPRADPFLYFELTKGAGLTRSTSRLPARSRSRSVRSPVRSIGSAPS